MTGKRVATCSSDAPGVDIRPVLFTVSDGRLLVALHRLDDKAWLPRGEPRADELLDATAARVLGQQLAIEERYLEQLYSISQGTTEDWTVTIAYLGLAQAGLEATLPRDFQWCDTARLPRLNGTDSRIIDYAVLRLRAKLGYTTIAFHLLPPSFTLSELQAVYEAVLDRPLDKRNFRRRIQAGEFLEATGEIRRDGSHRPARLFRFRAAHDADTYLTPSWAVERDERATAT